MRIRTKNKKAMLDMITTAILLVTFILVLTLLSAIIAIANISGSAAGKVVLDLKIGRSYAEEKTLLYLTDDYGNKLTDLMGQELLMAGAKVTVPGNAILTIPPEAISNAIKTCTPGNTIGRTRDSTYDTTQLDLSTYLHCYVVPKKLSMMYGRERYCLYLVYDEGGLNTATMYGNDTISKTTICSESKKVSADITPPPGFDKPILMRLQRA